MLKSMKHHMLMKLQTRYNENQIMFLEHCTFLDPRLKSQVKDMDDGPFIDRVTSIAENYTDFFQATESQRMENIEKPTFSHTRRNEPQAATSSSSSSKTGEKPKNVHDLFMDSDSDDDENTISSRNELKDKIIAELDIYKQIHLKSDVKTKVKLLEWWQQRRHDYPNLFKAVRGMLSTPATSVPSERVFSEAGYISRARRSNIHPKNVNRFLFIKKNRSYIPENIIDFFSEDEQ